VRRDISKIISQSSIESERVFVEKQIATVHRREPGLEGSAQRVDAIQSTRVSVSGGSVKRALVLAGGGVAGIAWELGVLFGISELEPELARSIVSADLIIGTSAGSAVAVQISSDVDLEALYEAQCSAESSEIMVDFDATTHASLVEGFIRGSKDGTEIRRAIGKFALSATTIAEKQRRLVIATRLPKQEWPAQALWITAVDAESGELEVFTAESGVDLVDAVAASCAVPGVWPPVSIAGRKFIDGGVRSTTNADLAIGYDRVLVITPSAPDVPYRWGSLREELQSFGPEMTRVLYANSSSRAAFGSNPLSPSSRGQSAIAGRAIGRTRARELVPFWTVDAPSLMSEDEK
jgi:NTE family protein